MRKSNTTCQVYPWLLKIKFSYLLPSLHSFVEYIFLEDHIPYFPLLPIPVSLCPDLSQLFYQRMEEPNQRLDPSFVRIARFIQAFFKSLVKVLLCNIYQVTPV